MKKIIYDFIDKDAKDSPWKCNFSKNEQEEKRNALSQFVGAMAEACIKYKEPPYYSATSAAIYAFEESIKEFANPVDLRSKKEKENVSLTFQLQDQVLKL